MTNYLIQQALGLLILPALVFVIWYGIKKKITPINIIIWSILQLSLWPLFLPLYLFFNWLDRNLENLTINGVERKINLDNIISALAPFVAIGLNIVVLGLFNLEMTALMFLPFLFIGAIAIPFSIAGMVTHDKTKRIMFGISKIISFLSIQPGLFIISTVIWSWDFSYLRG